jgi:hypothetical protein
MEWWKNVVIEIDVWVRHSTIPFFENYFSYQITGVPTKFTNPLKMHYTEGEADLSVSFQTPLAPEGEIRS